MNNFKTALNNVVNEMIDLNLIACANISWNDSMDDQATVHFLEEDGSNRIHGLMLHLYTKLSDKLGHPVSICHNSPTDGQIQVLGGAGDSEVYYSDECCKLDMCRNYNQFIHSDRTGYSEQVRSVFLACECLAEGLNKTPQYVMQCLDWNRDPQAQLIQMLIDYHA